MAAGAAGEYVGDGGEWQPVSSFECRGVEPVRLGGGGGDLVAAAMTPMHAQGRII